MKWTDTQDIAMAPDRQASGRRSRSRCASPTCTAGHRTRKGSTTIPTVPTKRSLKRFRLHGLKTRITETRSPVRLCCSFAGCIATKKKAIPSESLSNARAKPRCLHGSSRFLRRPSQRPVCRFRPLPHAAAGSALERRRFVCACGSSASCRFPSARALNTTSSCGYAFRPSCRPDRRRARRAASSPCGRRRSRTDCRPRPRPPRRRPRRSQCRDLPDAPPRSRRPCRKSSSTQVEAPAVAHLQACGLRLLLLGELLLLRCRSWWCRRWLGRRGLLNLLRAVLRELLLLRRAIGRCRRLDDGWLALLLGGHLRGLGLIGLRTCARRLRKQTRNCRGPGETRDDHCARRGRDQRMKPAWLCDSVIGIVHAGPPSLAESTVIETECPANRSRRRFIL